MASETGASLYALLPAVYRVRDEPASGLGPEEAPGDLRNYLDAAGDLLDAVLNTLRQRLADNFPDQPDGVDAGGAPARACQDWLLPYFAELLDARLLAPDADGQRDEIANAVRWRQGKGTLSVLDSVFESMGQSEAVVQEGWQRLAVTPRVGEPLRPARSLGYAREPEARNPGSMARHPDLPAITPDVRCPSRAVATTAANAGAQALRIDGERVWVRQASLHGAPCFPGSYEDRSLRTPDLRDPDWRVGHHHPRRVVAYVPPPSGFFPPDAPAVNWADEPGDRFRALIEVVREGDTTIYRNRTLGTRHFVPVRIRRTVPLGSPPGFAGAPDAFRWRFEGLVFENTVEVFEGRAAFANCALRTLVSHAVDRAAPTLMLQDCLVGRLQNARGLARLVYCTLLGDCLSEALEASDSVFLGALRADHPGHLFHAGHAGGDPAPDAPPRAGCLRFCRIAPGQDTGELRLHHVTRDRVPMLQVQFGQRSCGVLHPACSAAIARGAEDEGELGAYHHRHHLRALAAMQEKTAEFLPVGLRVAVAYDARLAQVPRP